LEVLHKRALLYVATTEPRLLLQSDDDSDLGAVTSDHPASLGTSTSSFNSINNLLGFSSHSSFSSFLRSFQTKVARTLAIMAASAPATARSKPLGNPPPTLLISTLIPIALILIAHPLLPLFLPTSVISSLPPQPGFPGLQASIGFAMLAFVGAIMSVPACGEAFIDKGLKGRDLLKPGGRTSGPWM
jgi:pilus assembly protein TadC